MSEAEIVSGVGRQDIEAALADPTLASLRLSGAPVVVVASDPGRVVFATEPAKALFGGDAAFLTRRLLHGGEPGAQRLAALSRSLLPGAAPRLERLRFFFGPVAETVTVLCRRVARSDGPPLFAVAALGVRAPSSPNVEPDAPERLGRTTSVAPAVGPNESAAQAPVTAMAMTHAVRFGWRTDGDHVIEWVSPALAGVVGEVNAHLVGRSFVDVARELALDPCGRLAAALATRDTWAGVEVAWPVGDGAMRAPVTLGAAPAFDAEENFLGFRGFGLLYPGRMAPVEAAPVLPASGEAPPPPSERPAGPSPSSNDEGGADQVVSVTDTGAPVVDAGRAPAAQTPDKPHDQAAVAGDAPELDGAPEQDDEPAPAFGKIVPLRRQQAPRPAAEPSRARAAAPSLSPGEKSAFDEIARALGAEAPAQEQDDRRAETVNRRARDLIDLVARFGRADEPAHAPALVAVASSPEPAREPSDNNARALLDRLPVGIVISRFNVPIYANRTLLDLIDYADADAFHAAGGMDRLFNGRSPDSGASQIEARDGELIPVDARVQAIEWDGQPATLVTLRRAQDHGDSARVKALELELRQRDADAREMHAILDTATDGVAVLDAEGRILSLNRSGEALFGYDQNEVAGEHFSTLVSRESQDVVASYFDGVKSGGVASVLNDGREIIGLARQGGAIPVFMTLGRLGSGATPKFCAVLRDLTAWKRAERELGDARRDAERASALKSDFLAKVSHEIRTPLNAILGFAEVIMDERFGPVGNDRYRDYMRDIHKSGEHVLSLVNDLLDLSKIEAGKVDLTFTSVDANAIVAECVSIMQPQASRERVVMRLSLAPNLPNIVADERSLRQIVLNLLSNAVKFNEAGGQAIVSTALTDAGHAVIRIKDTGVGMSDSELETALEPFRQVATSRKVEGTGLGLPLTKALVEANRAAFTIKSRKGEGTLVEVVFPPTRVLAE